MRYEGETWESQDLLGQDAEAEQMVTQTEGSEHKNAMKWFDKKTQICCHYSIQWL